MNTKLLLCGALLTTGLTVIPAQASQAGYIMDDIEITRIYPTSNGNDAFWVHFKTTSNTNNALCTNIPGFLQNRVKLVKSAPDSSITIASGPFTRSFSLATTALVSGKKVHLWAYNTASTSKDMCSNGVVGAIELTSTDVN